MSKSKIKDIFTYKAPQCCDSLEISPSTGIIALGTYHLENDVKSGSIQLFNREYEITKKIDCNAVLDMQWHGTRLLSADEKGKVIIYDEELKKICDWYNGKQGSLNLSLDVNNNGSSVITSQSDGSVSLLSYTPDSLKETKTWGQAHSLEVWMCAFNAWDTNVLYSGADDSLLKGWDLRCDESVFVDKSHDAGVTAIRSHPTNPNLLLTGSYDEYIRVFDTRMIPRFNKFEKGLLYKHHVVDNGGIWRFKWHPKNPERMLVACMYEGFRILDFVEETGEFKTVADYLEHESLAYGLDWFRCADKDIDLLATCSFYDHLFKIWEIEY